MHLKTNGLFNFKIISLPQQQEQQQQQQQQITAKN